MPKKSTKHIPKPQDPVGWIRHGKIKTIDGDTGKVVHRGVRRGMLRDYDSDVTSERKDARDAKKHKTHTPRSGRPRRRTPETKG